MRSSHQHPSFISSFFPVVSCLTTIISSSLAFRSDYATRLLRDAVIRDYNEAFGTNVARLPPSLDDYPYFVRRRAGFDVVANDSSISGGGGGSLISSFHISNTPGTTPSEATETQKICVIGAGVSGLYLAWMLTFLGLPYDILEASSRVGGRAFTYRFPGGQSGESAAHDYYDVGAMRYPEIEALKPVFTVFEKLGIRTEKYYLENPSAPWRFNGRGGGGVNSMADALRPFQDAVSPFINLLTRDFDAGFDHLVKTADQYSTREYLHDVAGLGFDEIQRLETFDTGTGLFDQAFSESVLDWYDFATAKSWVRIENGTSVLVDAMLEKLHTQPSLNTIADAIRMADGGQSVEVRSTDIFTKEQAKNKYAAIFSTTSLGCLQRIDLGELPVEHAPYKQRTAIRSLHYDDSAKVAIKFRSAWWITLGGMTPLGGASNVDSPIRLVVYPSWMEEDDPKKPAVLIGSYTWSQDAIRMSSLISKGSPNGEEELMDVVLRDLADLFSDRNITLEFLQSQIVTHHAWSWSQDPNTAGAFALFGPGQFTSLYPDLVRPLAGSGGRVHIVGEHASAHHAWMSGPMYSAATSLYMYLSSGDTRQKDLAKRLKQSWFGASIDSEEEVLMWAGHLARNEAGRALSTE